MNTIMLSQDINLHATNTNNVTLQPFSISGAITGKLFNQDITSTTPPYTVEISTQPINGFNINGTYQGFYKEGGLLSDNLQYQFYFNNSGVCTITSLMYISGIITYTPIWTSYILPGNKSPFTAFLTNNGMFVIIDSNNNIVYTSSNTNSGIGPYTMTMNNDGSLTIVDNNNNILWSIGLPNTQIDIANNTNSLFANGIPVIQQTIIPTSHAIEKFTQYFTDYNLNFYYFLFLFFIILIISIIVIVIINRNRKK